MEVKKIKISLKDLSEYIAYETNLLEESVEQAIRFIRSGIDHAVAEEHIEGTVKTLEGISMSNLTNTALIQLAINSNLDSTKAQQIVQSLQEYIVQNLNKGYEVEIEGLGTYRKPSKIKELDVNSQLEFEPLPFPDIPLLKINKIGGKENE